MSAEGLQASVEKMRRERRARRRDRDVRALLRAARGGRVRAAPRGRDRAGPRAARTPTRCRDADAPLDQAVVIKLNGGLGTSMGMYRAKSLLEVKDGLSFLDVIARQVLALREASGARLPLVLMNSFYTRDDSLALLERYDGPRVRRAVRLRPAQGAEAARRRPDAGRVAARPEPRVVPARPRRHLPGAADVGDARDAARARLPLRVHVELRQPRRGARPAHPRLVRRRAAPVPRRGDRAHAGRPQGRPHRGAQGDRRADPARDRADARGGHGRVHRRRAAPVLPRQQPLGRPAGARPAAARARRRAGAADDRQREDRRPGGRLLARRLPARDGDGRGDRRLRGRAGDPRAARAVRAGQEDAATCWCCARTPTCSATARGSSWPKAATRPPLVELDDEHFKLLDDFDARFPAGPPSLVARRAAGGPRRRDVRPRRDGGAAT